jgi:hypothetical protein
MTARDPCDTDPVNKKLTITLDRELAHWARRRAAGEDISVSSRRLEGEKLGPPPAFGCDARPLGCNRVGGFTGEVPHDLPTDGRSASRSHLRCAGRGA